MSSHEVSFAVLMPLLPSHVAASQSEQDEGERSCGERMYHTAPALRPAAASSPHGSDYHLSRSMLAEPYSRGSTDDLPISSTSSSVRNCKSLGSTVLPQRIVDEQVWQQARHGEQCVLTLRRCGRRLRRSSGGGGVCGFGAVFI